MAQMTKSLTKRRHPRCVYDTYDDKADLIVLVCQNEKCKAVYCKVCVLKISNAEAARLTAVQRSVSTPEHMVCWFCKKKVVPE